MSSREDADRHARTTQVLVTSMIAGQVLFAGIGWYLHQSGLRARGALALNDPIVLAWLMVAVGSLFGALYFRARIAGAGGTAGTGSTGAPTDPRTVQRRVLTMWVLIEGAALFGLIVYFLHGQRLILLAALAYVALAGLLFFPRRSWFPN